MIEIRLFYDFETEYNFKLADKEYENIGCVNIPTIKISMHNIEGRSKMVKLNFLYLNGWDDIYQLNAYKFYYEDKVENWKFHNASFLPSDVYYGGLGLFSSPLQYCDPIDDILDYSDLIIKFKS